MDQEETMDFKALRAKFQEEELLLKQPRIKPALPDKPKVVPPPQSPTHYIPAGARPSLLTSINQTLVDGRTPLGPRVVFKDEKKESKKPLIQTNSKGKDGKLKGGKDKSAKGSKEKLSDDSVSPKQKKEKGGSSAELVAAAPPPKTTSKKKGFLGFKKSKKAETVEVPADPILDTPSSDVLGPAPLIPLTTATENAEPEPEPDPHPPAPRALLPNIPASPDSGVAAETTPPSSIPSPTFNPPSPVIPDFPAPELPTPVTETPPEAETPTPPVSRPASINEIIPSPPSAAPTPPPNRAHQATSTPSSSQTPSPSPPKSAAEVASVAVVETPPPPIRDPSPIPPSPTPERSISALSALERAEDMTPPKKTTPADKRILNALEKARKKVTSSQSTPATSFSASPPPDEPPHPESVFELPPIDYEDRAGRAHPPQLNGIDHRQPSPVTEVGSEDIPELLVVPPPTPKKILPDAESLGSAPEKPSRPPSVNLSDFIPPPPLQEDANIAAPAELPAPTDFSETDTADIPEFDDVPSDAHSLELPASEWVNGEHAGPETPDGQDPPELYSNSITAPGAEVQGAPVLGDDSRDSPLPALPDPSLPIAPDTPATAGNQGDSGVYESTENVYEDIAMSATKKKGKNDGGKKRKGPPKNPYAEAAQEANEDKSKTIRFGKSDKKASAEGPDEKELKKKEKQRLEKEKKELKEKQEREKKEQKEREKKENEMKKKFKITGQEEAMYQATVTVTTKGRKNDLPVKSGDIVSIIRTTNCPKGKWLARDSSNNYGYVGVDHVELDIKEMLELGKKAAISRNTNSNVIDVEVTSTGSRTSNHYPLSTGSFSDDSEWTGDEEEPLSSPTENVNPLAPSGHTRTLSMPDMGNKELSINHQHSHSDLSPDGSNVQARHEALQKLATFFHAPKPVEPTPSSTEPETSPVIVEEEAPQPTEAGPTLEMDFDNPELLILPPPDLYADLTLE